MSAADRVGPLDSVGYLREEVRRSAKHRLLLLAFSSTWTDPVRCLTRGRETLQAKVEEKEERSEALRRYCQEEVSVFGRLTKGTELEAASLWPGETCYRQQPNPLLQASKYPLLPTTHPQEKPRPDTRKGFRPISTKDWLVAGLTIFFWCPVRFFGRMMQAHFGESFYPPCPSCNSNKRVTADGWVKYPRKFLTACGHQLVFSSQWRCQCGEKRPKAACCAALAFAAHS